MRHVALAEMTVIDGAKNVPLFQPQKKYQARSATLTQVRLRFVISTGLALITALEQALVESCNN